jgi:AbrB family looped-hinge helix DNA binding protein
MAKYVATLSQDGQIALPEEVREALNLHPNDHIAFIVDNGTVTLIPEQPELAWRAGVLKPLPAIGDDLERIIEEAKEDYFAEKYERLRRQ